MANSTGTTGPNSEVPIKGRPLSGIIAVICSLSATLIMAFLVPFGVLQSCSPANIAIFLWLFGLSAALAFCGIVFGASSYRKAKNRLATISLVLTILYVALLLYLIILIYSWP